jgi:hypothetical protein
MYNTQFTELQKRLKLQCFIAEARLDTDVAFLGKMSPYTVVTAQGTTWTSKVAKDAGQLPVWNDAHLIEADLDQKLEITVLHKTMIFADVEVGHASIGLGRLPLKNEWIELHKEGSVVGKLRVTLVASEELTADFSHFSTRHSSHNSAELKDDIVRKMQELEQERKELKAAKMRYQEKLNKLAQLGRGETTDKVRDLKATLDIEKGVVGQQELKIRETLNKLKVKADKLTVQRRKLRNFRDELKGREQDFLKRRDEIEIRHRRLSVRHEEIERSQADLVEEFKKVQKDRQKLNVQHKISAISKRHVTQDKRALLRRKQAHKAPANHFSPQVGRIDSELWLGCATECEKENLLDSCVKTNVPRSTGKAPLSPLAVQMIQQVRSGRLICF